MLLLFSAAVIISVCPLSARTIKSKRLKLKSPNLAHRTGRSSGYLARQLILGQKVKGQSYRVKKCKKVATRQPCRAAPCHCDVTPLNETAWVMHFIECLYGPLVFIARQHTGADARYWYSNSVRPSVCLSVRNTLVLYENGLTYRHSFSTIR